MEAAGTTVKNYATVRCRVLCQHPNAWKPWESEVKHFLRDRAGPGKVPADQRQAGEPLFNWKVTWKSRRGRAQWPATPEYLYYDVWFKDPTIATLFSLQFAEYLDV